ncbi:MAG: hypothetical protein ACRDLB_06910 [Actinomycetota bacterium]
MNPTSTLCVLMAVAMLVTSPSRALWAGEEEATQFGLRHGRLEVLSVTSGGAQVTESSGTACSTVDPVSMSDNGRYVAFSSESGDLDSRDVNGGLLSDIFLRDRKTRRTEIVSLSSSGSAPTPPVELPLVGCLEWSLNPSVSSNGRFVAFASKDPTFAPQDVDELLMDVFVRDRKKGRTELVSAARDVGGADSHSGLDDVMISANGRYVAFESYATTLTDDEVASPTCVATPFLCPLPQVYLYDRSTKMTSLVSRSTEGAAANARARLMSISDDGRYVVFDSAADNLSPNDRNVCVDLAPSCDDAFVHDLKKGTTELVSISREGRAGDRASGQFSFEVRGQKITPDGRFVVFQSGATDLVPAGSNTFGSAGVFMRDRTTGRTERISVTSEGIPFVNGGGHTSISDRGRYVSFEAMWTGSAQSTDEPYAQQCQGTFLHDRRTGQTDLVRLEVCGDYSYYENGASWGATMSGDASFVAFATPEQEIPEDQDDTWDVYVRDLRAMGLGADVDGSSPTRSLRGDDVDLLPDGLARIRDPHGDVAVPGVGGEIIAATVAHRPSLSDIFVRIDLDRLPGLKAAGLGGPLIGNPFVIYGITFGSKGVSYEVRIARTPRLAVEGADPAFGLFRCLRDACTKIASLKGGYGTVGEAVVAAVPLDAMSFEAGETIEDLEAFSAIGTYTTGAVRVLDRARLR